MLRELHGPQLLPDVCKFASIRLAVTAASKFVVIRQPEADMRENHGFSKADVTAFVRRMQNVVGSLCTEWKAIHATLD